jgi:hypothetical protein
VELFSIVCSTCNSRLKVRDTAAIGQILNCPKCQSMVLVQPPDGWQPGSPGAQSTTDPASGRRRWENEVQPGEKVTSAAATPGSGGFHFGESSSGVSSSDVSSTSKSGLSSTLVPQADRGSQAQSPSASRQPQGVAASIRAISLPAGWLKWAVLAGVPTVVIALASGIWLTRRVPEPVGNPPALAEVHKEATPIEHEEPAPPPKEASTENEPVRLSRRWLPTNSQAVVSLRAKLLVEQPAAQVVLDRTSAFWHAAVGKLASALEIEPQSFERATWSSSDLASLTPDDWLTQAVVVVELDQPVAEDARCLRDSEPLGLKLDGTPLRELKSGAWPHPFALIEKRTIVTGPERALRELAGREDHVLANDALQQLVDVIDARSAAVALIDLRALRDIDALPHWLPLVDTLRADADDWELLRAIPLALGVAVGLDKRLDVEIDLACDGATGAEQVQAALDRILKAVEETIGSEAEGLTARLMAGEINTALASELKDFLAGSQPALAGRAVGVREAIAWARLNCQGDLPKLATGFLASIPQLEASRLAAALRLDEEHHRLLMESLAGYVKAEGGLPAGAAGATLLPPETRLSWQATLLPYFGRLDWHKELNFARSWNDASNQRVTLRPLDVVVNPALQPVTTETGYPVTHYVGVAGLGADAGQLDADDPRAGVFGFRSRFAPAQIPDGASNTIAVAGVSQKLGPWASGGPATVRGLAQRPYINGPDGFGSGQPGGMLVGMADGSVRFIPSEIDPDVFERMVTINGGSGPADTLANAKATAPSHTAPRNSAIKRAPAPPPAMSAPAENTMAAKSHAAKAKAAAPSAEIARHLNDRIPQIEQNTTLSALIDFLSQLSTIPMTLDAESLSGAGVGPDASVSISLTNATVGDVLDEALRQYGLQYVAVGNQLVITDARQKAESLESATFNVADLIGSEPQGAQRLARLVEEFVDPSLWQSSGGTGSIHAVDRTLEIKQTAEVASQTADFLDKLRIARGVSVSRREARRLSLVSRSASLRAKLATKVTANFTDPTRLKQITAHLQKVVGIEITFDGVGMASAGVSPDARASVSSNQEPLGNVLERLLDPLELAYRVVNAQRIEITAAREVADDLEVEFYPIKSLLADGATDADDNDFEQFSARVRKEVSPSSWRERGGSSTFTVDAASSCLIVLAPQPVQIELEHWLEQQSQSAAP